MKGVIHDFLGEIYINRLWTRIPIEDLVLFWQLPKLSFVAAGNLAVDWRAYKVGGRRGPFKEETYNI